MARRGCSFFQASLEVRQPLYQLGVQDDPLIADCVIAETDDLKASENRSSSAVSV